MDLIKYESRVNVGNNLKVQFRSLMTGMARGISADKFSYLDMKLISEAMELEVPKMVGVKELPPQVKAALMFATASLDPNKARREDLLKKGFAVCAGAGGATLAITCLGMILNPGIIATAALFFTGGIAGGPLAVAGAVGGGAIVVASIYKVMSKKTPNERWVKCCEIVDKAIDSWVQNGCKEDISL